MINNKKRSSILSPLSDYWLLGGLSILLCLALHIANFFKNDFTLFQTRFMQLGAVFSILSIVCNHPHFMVSYRFGYGRGLSFILKNWFALIFIPIFLLGIYSLAFFNYNYDIYNLDFLDKINSVFSSMNLKFKIDTTNSLGEELMGLSIWFMYLTVGWHYAKQAYGCMMVYAFYDDFKLSLNQKKILKYSVITLAAYQFLMTSQMMDQYKSLGVSIQDPRFQGIHLASLGLPEWMFTVSKILSVGFFIGSLIVFFQVQRKTKKWPPLNFLIPWAALYIWWLPVGNLPEFYLLTVPFFHSLQYLPFAARVEIEKINKTKAFDLQLSIRILILLFVGFSAFELIPSILDSTLETDINQTSWFFMIAFSVFINIHHFFIDSVVWKLKDAEIKSNLLYEKQVLNQLEYQQLPRIRKTS